MTLPRLLVLTDRTQCAGPLPRAVEAAVEAGARAVVLREKDLPGNARAALAAELAGILAPVRGTLIVAGRAGGGAVHLAARDAFPGRPRPALVGRSCHDLAEVAAAAAEGCDYVTVSPVYPSASKPGYGPPLGPAGLATLARATPAVYALGGVGPEHVADCRAAGAYGVAVMGGVMRDPHSVAEYLSALHNTVEDQP
ncbi:thiamine-phosphate synthase [Asanoa ishikariensis]|uniref:Thiamine-phosphate pyrophosphorylase n=1 Tax=Asanoa ishikariensis TaxID=137265 RepID=A0A1H3UIG1_9ACTN|nr:thiamine phosphate synthase [Asanoa ishikariensis]GIF63458.1 thiamine-phosphate synthase [Asanoa ishikariensis]SDZ62107.1 thiamine-phosphate pyrophosphorylase [Asanoa ishikariensis]